MQALTFSLNSFRKQMNKTTCFWVLFTLLHLIEILPEASKCLKRHEHFSPYRTYTILCNHLKSYSGFLPDLF